MAFRPTVLTLGLLGGARTTAFPVRIWQAERQNARFRYTAAADNRAFTRQRQFELVATWLNGIARPFGAPSTPEPAKLSALRRDLLPNVYSRGGGIRVDPDGHIRDRQYRLSRTAHDATTGSGRRSAPPSSRTTPSTATSPSMGRRRSPCSTPTLGTSTSWAARARHGR